MTATPPPLPSMPENHDKNQLLRAATEPVRDVWWLGCHGGSGVTTLATLTGIGRDCGTHIGHLDWAEAQPGLVLVCRSHSSGTASAARVIGQSQDPAYGAPPVLGVAVVADCGRKPPRIVADRIQVWSQSMRVWQLPWVDALRADVDAIDVPPPAYTALADELSTLVPSPAALGNMSAYA
ncbi:hypothetical protein [Natronoglycomyces albus]|uniref:Uncharacterized protein n=1 Tax=Natronoglycomyces albus TaxID=2811108 RepID=A0A895Y052_9ACTN|nr:hypothetical protein [Natronoglycomyces albus]QSB07188.1 hypothetical protein JQS30_16930 [Natronoglycomyces albus]